MRITPHRQPPRTLPMDLTPMVDVVFLLIIFFLTTSSLIEITRAEEGCIQYDLHQDNENPAHFLFYETWQSRELWQAHMNAPHLATYGAATQGAVAQFTLHEMTKIA